MYSYKTTVVSRFPDGWLLWYTNEHVHVNPQRILDSMNIFISYALHIFGFIPTSKAPTQSSTAAPIFLPLLQFPSFLYHPAPRQRLGRGREGGRERWQGSSSSSSDLPLRMLCVQPPVVYTLGVGSS